MTRKGACLLCGVLVLAMSVFGAGDDYHARKLAMVGRSPTKTYTTISNDSIAIHIDTETGQFNLGTLPDSTTLIFAFPSGPGTSNTVFNIDNTSTCDYVNETWASFADPIMDYASITFPFTLFPASGGSSYVEGGWVVDNVRFMQKIYPVYLERPDGKIAGSCYIEYRVANLDATAHQVGVRLQMDTMIDDNDAARVATIFGYNNYEQVFIAPDIPGVYSAFRDTLPDGNPDPASLKATGYLSPSPLVPEAVTPDRFALGSWPDFTSLEPWYFTAAGGEYWDSAVLIWWEDYLAPGDSVIYGTYYGIGLPDYTPPVATPLVPAEDIWTACANTDIALRIEDDEIVNESSIELEVNGETYTTTDDELNWVAMSDMLVFTPAVPFANNSTVDVSLLTVADMEGNALEEPVSWSFKVDDEGAAVTDMHPNGGLAPLLPTLTCKIFDDETGIDESTIEIMVDGITYYYPMAGMTYDSVSGDFEFDLAAAGLPPFPMGHTVEVQVTRADDRVDTCGPHAPQPHTWSFVTSTPPVPILLMPGDGDTTTCEDQKIRIHLSGGSGIDSSSIVLWIDSDSFTLDDPSLILLPNDTLFYDPSAAFTYPTGEVTIRLNPVSDTLGAASDTAEWHFWVDLLPPVMSNESPTSPPDVATFNFDISMDITDNMLPIDVDSIRVEIINNNNRDTTVVLSSDPFTTWADPTFSFPANQTGVSFNDGEDVIVRLLVRDLPPATSDCAGNKLDTSFTFTIAETPCKRSPNPITPGVSPGKNDEVVFEFPNMRKTDLEVHIYIYDLRNNLVADIDRRRSGEWRWDGKDQAKNDVAQGTYIYLIKAGDETACTGTISIAR